MKKSIILILITFSIINVNQLFAQEQTLYFMNNVWQSNLLNPAFQTEKKFNICLPSVYANAHSPLALNDLVVQKSGKKVLTLNNSTALAKLEATNDSRVDLNFQTAALSIGIGKKLRLNIHHAIKNDTRASFTKDLANLAIKGNYPYIGQNLVLDLGLSENAYNELGFGMSYAINDNLSVGARFKKLNGVGGVFTEGSKLNLTTDTSTYGITLNTDYKIKTFVNSEFAPSDLFKANGGAAFDLGATFKIGKLNLSAALIDLGGSINWEKGDTYIINANNVQYKGVTDYNNAFNNSAGIGDSLKQKFGYTETKGTATYKHKMPLKTFIACTYQINEKFRVGALIHTETSETASNVNATIDGTARLGKIFDVGASIGLRNKSFNNLGFHAALKLSVIQLYFVTDNVLGIVNYAAQKDFNGRFGLNIIF